MESVTQVVIILCTHVTPSATSHLRLEGLAAETASDGNEARDGPGALTV
jgi:hypothetical protein